MLTNRNEEWKRPTYLIGGAIGLVLGLITAHFYTQSVKENQPDNNPPAAIATTDIFKLALTLVGFMRSISDLGARRP